MIRIKVDEEFTLNVIEEEEKPDIKLEHFQGPLLERNEGIPVGLEPAKSVDVDVKKEHELNGLSESQELKCIVNTSIKIETTPQDLSASCREPQTSKEAELHTCHNNILSNNNVQTINEENDIRELEVDLITNEPVEEKIKKEIVDIIDLTNSEDLVTHDLQVSAVPTSSKKSNDHLCDNTRETVICSNRKSAINSSDTLASNSKQSQQKCIPHEVINNNYLKETPTFLKIDNGLGKESNFLRVDSNSVYSNLSNPKLKDNIRSTHAQSKIPFSPESTKEKRLSNSEDSKVSENSNSSKKNGAKVAEVVSMPKPDISKFFLYSPPKHPKEADKDIAQNQRSAVQKESKSSGIPTPPNLSNLKKRENPSDKQTKKASNYIHDKSLNHKHDRTQSKNRAKNSSNNIKQKQVRPTSKNFDSSTTKNVKKKTQSGSESQPVSGAVKKPRLPKNPKRNIGKTNKKSSKTESLNGESKNVKSCEQSSKPTAPKSVMSDSGISNKTYTSDQSSNSLSELKQADNNKKIVNLLRCLLREENQEEKQKIGKMLKNLLDEDDPESEKASSPLSATHDKKVTQSRLHDDAKKKLQNGGESQKVGATESMKCVEGAKNLISLRTSAPPALQYFDTAPVFSNNEITVTAVPSHHSNNDVKMATQNVALHEMPSYLSTNPTRVPDNVETNKRVRKRNSNVTENEKTMCQIRVQNPSTAPSTKSQIRNVSLEAPPKLNIPFFACNPQNAGDFSSSSHISNILSSEKPSSLDSSNKNPSTSGIENAGHSSPSYIANIPSGMSATCNTSNKYPSTSSTQNARGSSNSSSVANTLSSGKSTTCNAFKSSTSSTQNPIDLSSSSYISNILSSEKFFTLNSSNKNPSTSGIQNAGHSSPSYIANIPSGKSSTSNSSNKYQSTSSAENIASSAVPHSSLGNSPSLNNDYNLKMPKRQYGGRNYGPSDHNCRAKKVAVDNRRKSESWKDISQRSPNSEEPHSVSISRVPNSDGNLGESHQRALSLAEKILENSRIRQIQNQDTNNVRKSQSHQDLQNRNLTKNNRNRPDKVSSLQRNSSDFYIRNSGDHNKQSGTDKAESSGSQQSLRRRVRSDPRSKNVGDNSGPPKLTKIKPKGPSTKNDKFSIEPNRNLNNSRQLPNTVKATLNHHNGDHVPSHNARDVPKINKRRNVSGSPNLVSPSKKMRSGENQNKSQSTSEQNTIPLDITAYHEYLDRLVHHHSIFGPSPAPALGQWHPYNIYASQFPSSKQNGDPRRQNGR